MVEIQFGARQSAPAVLAGIVVAREDVEAREPYVPLGNALVRRQQQYPRDPNKPAHGAYPLVMYFNRQIAPRVKIEGPVLFVDRSRDSLIEQRKSSFYLGDVNWQVRPVKNQDLGVENRGARYWRRNRYGRRRH